MHSACLDDFVGFPTVSPHRIQSLHAGRSFSTQDTVSPHRTQFLHTGSSFSTQDTVSPHRIQFNQWHRLFATSISIHDPTSDVINVVIILGICQELGSGAIEVTQVSLGIIFIVVFTRACAELTHQLWQSSASLNSLTLITHQPIPDSLVLDHQ